MENTPKKYTVAEIKELLKQITDEEDERLILLQNDERKGVQRALSSWKKALLKKNQLLDEQEQLLIYEKHLWNKGIHYIGGVDEVGRGPLAGPVVAASVILPQDVSLPGVTDSKQLSSAKREQFFDQIKKAALSISIGVVEPSLIDKLNIFQATKLAMKKAVEDSSLRPEFLLVDAVDLHHSIPQKSLVKGDSLSLSIASASIIAKVTRDRMMEEYDKEFPGYGFAQNAGYGTAQHLDGLKQHGATPIHRYSFSPVSQYRS